ncbi:MAG: hypothetical protein HY661_06015 [Betaproteobacteria bacterium]|nr:hypothetical protein [Betaproteobacteria bacterium]
MTTSDLRKLVQELEVYQTELQLQNEELRQARMELEATINELYDSAPLGYCTLSRYGDIEKASLSSIDMLGRPRTELLGRRFAALVSPESLADFNHILRRIMGTYDKASCIVNLMKGDHTSLLTYIQATGAGPDASFCRLALVDISSVRTNRRPVRSAPSSPTRNSHS